MASRLNRSVDVKRSSHQKEGHTAENCYCSLNAYKRYDRPLERVQPPANYPKDLSSVMHKDYSAKKFARSKSVAEIGRYSCRETVDMNNLLNMRMVGMKPAGPALPQNYATVSSTDFKNPRPGYLFQVASPRRDTEICPRPSKVPRENSRSEYKSKYRGKSYLCKVDNNEDDDARSLIEAVIPIGHVRKPWSKPSRSVEKTTIYKNDFNRPLEASYLTKQERDGFKDVYFANRNGEIITKPSSRINGNTIYKGDYIKPRRGSELVVPRMHFAQPNTHKTLTDYFLGRLPQAKKLESALANYTTYKKTFVDHHVHPCECPSTKKERDAPTAEKNYFSPQRKSAILKENASYSTTARPDLGTVLKKLGSSQTKKCLYRSLVRPSTGKLRV